MIEQKIDLIFREIKGIRVDMQVMKKDQDAMRGDIQTIRKDQGIMRDEFKGMKQEQVFIRTDVDAMKHQMNHRFDVLESKADQSRNDITEIKKSIARIDQSVLEDVVVILKNINQETEKRSTETSQLNDRIFQLEVKEKCEQLINPSIPV